MLFPQNAIDSRRQLTEEQPRAELLRSCGLEPRNKILLTGPPGSGKTSLAEAVATELMLPLLTVKYEAVIGRSLGETASRLGRLFGRAQTRKCVLFLGEFDAVAKERGGSHEPGEMSRLAGPLLLRTESLPSYVMAIAATSHEPLLDKVAWRRFQIIVDLPMPSLPDLE